MIVTLIGKQKLHKIILPKEISGNYWIYDETKEEKQKLLNIEAKDGKWKVLSNNHVKILDPKYAKIPEKESKTIKQQEREINTLTLSEYCIYIVKFTNREMQNDIYILQCLPAFEEDLIHLNIKHTQEILIGKSELNQISYDNLFVSNTHARIFFYNGRFIIENYDEKIGTYVNGEQIGKWKKVLSNGDVIYIMGLKIILLGNSIFINNPLNKIKYNTQQLIYEERKEEEVIETEEENKNIELYSPKDYFYKSPRIREKIERKSVKIEPPPAKQVSDKMQQILTIVSTLTMGLMSVFYIMQTIETISSGTASLMNIIMSVMMSSMMLVTSLIIPIISMKLQKKMETKYEEKRQKLYKKYINSKIEEVNNIKKEQRELLFKNYATVEECTKIIIDKTERLWERNEGDFDFLSVSLGTGDTALEIDVQYPEKKAFSMEDEDNLEVILNDFTKEVKELKNAPVTFSFLENKVSALVGQNEEIVQKFMQNLLIQLITFHNYHDLKFVCLMKKDINKKWDYIKMFPYVWNDSRDFRFFEEDNEDEMEEISKYLENEFDMRKGGGDQNDDQSKVNIPHYLIITDDYRKIQNLKIITKILAEKNNIGFSILCITNNLKQLPAECTKFISINDDNTGKLFGNELTEDSQREFKFNTSNIFFFDKIVRTIFNIPIKYKETEKNSLPNSYTFLEMYNVGLVEQLNILERWKNNDSTLSLAAPIGVRGSGRIINLDIHEKAHGPHGLIAGTTGSGKSEFIITYVLSLAVNYHPDDVAFILIDYKGGGLAGAFKKQDIVLPHLAGTITNIDTDGLNRSLVSIQSELKRRQKMFNEAREKTNEGTIDIYKYQKLYHNGVIDTPIPHLFIICDEFAELKQQQPDFMGELVSVARIGRSLGVHLILATQKPSGVVDEQIKSNSKFGICLKVQEKSDSTDIIETTDAAYLKQAGRFYIKVGNGEYYDLGQSGYSGAPYFPSDNIKKQADDSIKFISDTGNIIKESNDYTQKKVNRDGDQITQIIKHIYEVAKMENIKSRQLWLDDISEKIYLKETKDKYKFKTKQNEVIVTVGEYDDPEHQNQGIVNLNFTKNGNAIIYGNADSGKETLMSTIVYDLMTTYTTKQVWTYILDFGTEALKIFRNAPHVGEVIFAKDTEKLGRFFARMRETLKERKEILSEYNGDYNFYLKQTGKTMPLIVIMINGFESFNEKHMDEYDDLLAVLTREGSKLGIVFVISATNSNDVRYRMAQNFKQKMALKLNDSSDYGNIFEDFKIKKPSNKFARGLVNIEDNVYEFQTAKSCEPEDYNVFIKSEIERISSNNELIAEKIKILPEKVKLEEMEQYITDLTNVPLGLARKDIKVETFDFMNKFMSAIVGKDIDEVVQYAANLKEEIDLIDNVETIMIDAEKKILSGINDLSDNYKELISEEKSKKNKCVFIIGIQKFLDYMEQMLRESKNKSDSDEEDDDEDFMDGSEKLESIIKQCKQKKNYCFIIVDTASRFKEHGYDDWYSKNKQEDNIIYVGDGIDDQYLLDVNAKRKEISNNCGRSFGYINKKGKTTMIKLLGMKEKSEEDE